MLCVGGKYFKIQSVNLEVMRDKKYTAIVVHCCQLLSIVVHCDPLLSIVVCHEISHGVGYEVDYESVVWLVLGSVMESVVTQDA